jgi:hypothetical protein
MTIAAHPIEKTNDSSDLQLSFLESSVLKLYALGYSNHDARKILDIKQEQHCIIIQDLIIKYQAVDLFHTVKSALTHNYINRYDLVKGEVKKLTCIILTKRTLKVTI